MFFVEEHNKYAPGGPLPSPLTDLVPEIAERGRSLGVILISAQQFMSAVHDRVTGNCATKVLGGVVLLRSYSLIIDFLMMKLKVMSQDSLKGSFYFLMQFTDSLLRLSFQNPRLNIRSFDGN